MNAFDDLFVRISRLWLWAAIQSNACIDQNIPRDRLQASCFKFIDVRFQNEFKRVLERGHVITPLH